MKFIDDKNKKLTWWSRNYFYLGTILFIVLCISIHAIVGSKEAKPWIAITDKFIFYDQLVFNNLVQGWINTIFHFNWQHTLLNMLCFLICGLYIERKTGTLNFVLLTIATVFIESAFSTAANMSLNYAGASGMQFFLYGYIIIDYIFSFRKAKRNKTNTIFGGIVLAIIYVCMCFSGGTETFSFKIYPYDLLNNIGHYAPFFAGIIIGLIVQISQIKCLSCSSLDLETTLSDKLKKVYKIVYIVAISLVVSLISLCVGLFGATLSRKFLTVNIVCNYEEFNKTYILQKSDYLDLSDLLYDWGKENIVFEEGSKFDYVCEIYQDSKFGNKITSDLNARENYLFKAEFIPLSNSLTKTYYIDISKCYNLNFIDYRKYCDDIEVVNDYYNIVLFDKDDWVAKENSSFSFKIKNEIYSNLKVYGNGVEIFKGEDGLYTISNVSSDTEVTFGLS